MIVYLTIDPYAVVQNNVKLTVLQDMRGYYPGLHTLGGDANLSFLVLLCYVK